jgi:hypothetical protein
VLVFETGHPSPSYLNLYLETEVGVKNDDDKNASGRLTQRSYILARVEQLLDTKFHICKVIDLVRGEEGTFFYYLGLLFGMVLIGAYFWLILNATITNLIFHAIFVFSGIFLVASALGFAGANTRSSRVGLTMLAGIVGGIHAFLIFVLFTDLIIAIVLFAWIAFGTLVAFATLSWLQE